MHEQYGAAGARFYDAAYATREDLGPDVAFYRDLARETGGPVLELGCGTGRAILPVAGDGTECVGLDASEDMLDVLRAKAPPANLRVVRARMQDFDLGDERFALIFSAFRAFQHLDEVEDQLSCLANARRHLIPGGTLAFDVFNPRLDKLAVDAPPEVLEMTFPEGEHTVERWVTTLPDRVRQVTSVQFRYVCKKGRHRPRGAPGLIHDEVVPSLRARAPARPRWLRGCDDLRRLRSQ